MGKKNKNSGEALKKKQDKKLKQEEKAAKKAKKKGKKKDDVDDEEDIDDIIKSILKQDNDKDAPAVVQEVEQPCPRSSCSMTLVPNSGNATSLPEVILLGGELFDNNTNQCFNNMYRYNVGKNVWKSLTFNNGKGGPPARCSHQACTVRNHIYIFGGEYATAWQFYHYRDFWRFDMDTNKWEALDTRDGPPPRSGHRIAHWKHFLVLFGGFYEASRGVKWYNDLFFYDLRTQKWKQQLFPPHVQQPSARSGFSFVTHPTRDAIYCYGGYAKVTVSSTVQRGRQFDDMWRLNLDMSKGDGTWPTASWEIVPNRGRAPSPRSGVASALYKNRMIVFGGVTDNETSNDVEGEFHNSLFAFDMDRHRWFELNLRKTTDNDDANKKKKNRRKKKKEHVDGQEHDDDEDDDDEDDSSDSEGEDDIGGLNESAFYFIIDGKMVEVIDDTVDESDEADSAQADIDMSTAPNDDDKKTEVTESNSEVAQSQPDGSSDNHKVETTASPCAENSSGGANNDPNAADVVSNEKREEETKHVTARELAEIYAAQTSQVEQGVAELSVQETETSTPDASEPPTVPEEAHSAPEPRIGANIVIAGNKMIIYGGTTEQGNKQITFDDMWMLDLNQMDAWQELLPGTWRDMEWGDAEEEDDDEDGDDDDDDEGDDSDEDGEQDSGDDDQAKGNGQDRFQRNKLGISKQLEELREKLGVEAEESTPKPGETLREFFVRTCAHWLGEVAADLERKARMRRENNPGAPPIQTRHQGKDLRRMAFHKANFRFGELYPLLQELNELEHEQRLAEEMAQKYAEAQAKKAMKKKAGKKKR